MVLIPSAIFYIHYSSVSQPVGRGPQVGRGQLSMGLQSSHLLSFTTKLFNFHVMNHQI